MVFGYCITQLQEDVKDQQARLDELNTVLIQHANAITGSNFYLSKVIEYIGIENLDIEGGLDEQK